jgi:predicted AAA+ superfamily ATPase
MKASVLFKDGVPPEDCEDPDKEAEKLKFPWHCEKGIPKNIRKLNDEFNEVRGLKPVKIFITGPPASGKTYYSSLLSTYYNIPTINANDITKKAFELASKDDETLDEFGTEIKTKIEEYKDDVFAKM